MKRFFLIFFAIIFLLVGYHFWTAVNFDNIKSVKIAGLMLNVELASVPETQEKGLSGRNELRENKGMLFIFPKSAQYYFWMKDMNFSIDIIWIAEDMTVIYIKKNARPESYPETFGPDQNSKYVLEVVAGFSEKNNLKEGDRVEFVY